MQHRILSVSLSVISLLASSVFGQSSVLELGNAEGTFDGEVRIPLKLSTEIEVQAVQAVFDWAPSAGTGVDLIFEPAIEADADFVLSHIDVNWIAFGIVRFQQPLIGDDIELATAVIRCGPGPDVTETPVVFRDALYSASSPTLLLSNVVTVDGASVRTDDGLVLTSGSFRCGPVESYGLELGRGAGAFDGTVEIPLTLSTDAQVEAVQAVFEWDAAAGIGVELIVDPGIAETANVVLSHVEADWMTLGITIDSMLTGESIPLATAVIQCGSGPGVTDTPIVFRDDVHSAPGSPLPISNLVTVRGVPRLEEDGLELTDGSFRCSGPEICDDMADNDGDGLVDCEDPECGNEIDVTPLSLEFGDVPLGDASELPVTIANTGSCDLVVSAIELTPESSSDFTVAEPASAVILPGESLTALVTFAPGSAAPASGVLGIASDDADEPAVEVSLSGNGILAGIPQLAGDCNQDGSRNVSDVICMVKLAFPGFLLLDRSPPAPPCATDGGLTAILDLSGDSQVNGSDIVLLADFLFGGGAPPVQGVECFGVDEALGCGQNGGCL